MTYYFEIRRFYGEILLLQQGIGSRVSEMTPAAVFLQESDMQEEKAAPCKEAQNTKRTYFLL